MVKVFLHEEMAALMPTACIISVQLHEDTLNTAVHFNIAPLSCVGSPSPPTGVGCTLQSQSVRFTRSPSETKVQVWSRVMHRAYNSLTGLGLVIIRDTVHDGRARNAHTTSVPGMPVRYKSEPAAELFPSL